MRDWARAVGVSSSTLREWCYIAKLRPKVCLDFARMLRAVVLAQAGGLHPESLLDVSERRTMKRLLEGGALDHQRTTPSVQEFLTSQVFVTDRACLKRVAALLDDSR
jgi:hypothetical protein